MNAPKLLALAVFVSGCGSYFSPTATPRRDASSAADDGAVNGCAEARFVDRREANAARVVVFGGAVGMNFSPPCITVAPGQSVQFNGAFATHPLTPGVVGAAGAGSVITETRAGETASFTFPAVGDFPFHCGVHGSMGMVGVVRVR